MWFVRCKYVMFLRKLDLLLFGDDPMKAYQGLFAGAFGSARGWSTTIRKMTAAARAEGFDLTVATSRGEVAPSDIPIKNFRPVGEFELPEYELQKLSFPPVLEIVDYVQREGFTEVVISTPGPIGLCALLAAKILGLNATKKTPR